MIKHEALKAAKRVTFTDDQRKRSESAYNAVLQAIEIFYETSKSESDELTLAIRKLQEATHWHCCAIAMESK